MLVCCSISPWLRVWVVLIPASFIAFDRQLVRLDTFTRWLVIGFALSMVFFLTALWVTVQMW